MKTIFIYLYMCIVKIIALICRLFPVKKKIVMLVTFPDNAEQIIRKMAEKRFTPQTFLFYHPRLHLVTSLGDFVQTFPLKKANLIRLIFQLSTAKIVVIDNYFPELAAIPFRPDTVFQIWHANGALKKFAWEDQSVPDRSRLDQKRFKKVYSKYQNVVTGSDKMAAIFKNSFLLKEDNLLKIGVPSTDYFYNQKEVERARHNLRNRFQIGKKKTILYAPTFRDEELNSPKILLDMKFFRPKLMADYVLLLKLHPAVSTTAIDMKEDEFVKYIPSNVPMRELLVLADILVTDYSSSPFEYALFGRPIYFFTPDIDNYHKKRGLIDNFQEEIPGQYYRSSQELAEAIQNNQADVCKIKRFSAKWNKYSDGRSSERLVAEFQKRMNGGDR